MSTIHEMLRRVKSIDLQAIGVAIIVDSKPELLQLNKDQLMNDGVDKNSKKLKSYASNSYAVRKNRMNPFPGLGTPDLYLTGGFQNSFTLKINSKSSFEIFSTNGKSNDLTKKYGKNIFGLTENSKTEYQREVMAPELIKGVRKVMRL